MAQYQSFPGAIGDSSTVDKLKALRMPELKGRSFLDVGCNEGFFCGFADSQGASRSVGIDHSRQFIDRARRRFPGCEFLHQGWDHLPDGKFDVILLASALHYADDQPALLHRLVERLTPDGVLILELGIVPSAASEWVKVKRGIDERYFPTMRKLREVLDPHAWKWMGPSVAQPGDPVPRHVVHVSPRRPMAYLLLQPPAYGKSTIAASLFAPGHVAVLSGDELVDRVARKKLEAAPELAELLATDYSPFALDKMVQRIFELELGPQLVDLWLSQAGEGDFALDAYIPAEHHGAVEELLARAGYLPVALRWDRVGPRLLPEDVLAERAEAFYLSLDSGSALPAGGVAPRAALQSIGFIDELEVGDSGLLVRGWAIDPSGALPSSLAVQVNDEVLVVDRFERQLRPDVQRHMDLPHALVGYRFRLPLPGVGHLSKLRAPPRLYASHGGGIAGPPFRMAAPVARQFEQEENGAGSKPTPEQG